MSKSKIEHVNKAYSALRISGLTTDPTPAEKELALDMLEDMMSEFESRNICTNYIFEDDIGPNTDSGIASAYNNATGMSLAVRLANFYGKEVTRGIMNQANAGVSNWAARTGRTNKIQPPGTQPRGSGNTFRFSNWARYYRTGETAPISCDTFNLKVDGIDFFTVDFSSYLLEGATISSFIVESTNGVEVISSVQDVNNINLECKGVEAGYQTVTITITTSTGRVNPELINFNITDS